MQVGLTPKEEKNRKRAMIISAIVHLALILLAFLPLLTFPVPPPGQQGVLVSFGEPDKGRGDDRPDTQQELPEENTTQELTEEDVEEKDSSEPEESNQSQSAQSESKEVVSSENSDAARIEKQKKLEQEHLEEQKRQEQLERERIEKEKRQAEERRKQEEARKRAEQQKKYEEAKQQYGDLFGDGKGETDEAGNQGDPQGDPDSNILEGVSTGTGTVGGDLGNRGVAARPTIRDNSQHRGTVVIKVCVNANGEVISADFTQYGSTSMSENLRKKSVEAAKKFKFTPSDITRQCGKITFDYKLQ
jgi:flagellar biosynthesis GTPase FlhF